MTQVVTHEALKKLAEKFSFKSLSWRADTQHIVSREDGDYAAAFPYLDARDVQNRLDEVVGPENWKSEYTISAQGHIICRLSIFINGQWVSKEDGSAIETSGRAREMSAKTGFSDALKRAGVAWGIGRYLYAYRPELVKLAADKATLTYIPELPVEFLLESERSESQARDVVPRVATPAAKTTSQPAPAAVAATPVSTVAEAPKTVAAPETKPVVEAAKTEAPKVEVKAAVEDIPETKPVNTPAAKEALEAALGAKEADAPATGSALPVLDAAQQKVFDNLVNRIEGGLAATMLRGFISAPNTNLTDEARAYLMKKIDDREAKKG
jgi:hypothetical protein